MRDLGEYKILAQKFKSDQVVGMFEALNDVANGKLL